MAIRSLLRDRTRLALSVLGVALAITLILVLKGFLSGMNRQITAYLEHSPGSIVVAQEDVVNLLGATSLLPEGMRQRAEMVRDVEDAIPILSQFVILDLHDKKQPAYMIGYEPEAGGGPWELSEGREPHKKRELVFDRVLAQRHGLRLGDEIEVLEQRFTVVGLSTGTSSWMTSFFFVRKRDAEELLLAPGASSFLLLRTRTGADAGTILNRLNRFGGVNALSKQQMASNDLQLFAKVFSAPLKLMVSIAFLVGTMIVGLVSYTTTVERQRDYGVLKAIGVRNRLLYRVVLTQALVAAIGGATLGVLLANVAATWIMRARPQFLVVIERNDLAVALLAGIGMAVLAALFPARVVARLAPAEVFRR